MKFEGNLDSSEFLTGKVLPIALPSLKTQLYKKMILTYFTIHQDSERHVGYCLLVIERSERDIISGVPIPASMAYINLYHITSLLTYVIGQKVWIK